MDIMQMATQLLQEKLGGNASADGIKEALQGLLPGSGGNVDIPALVQKFTSSGNLGSVVTSWLGDGANQGISPSAIMEMFGSGKVAEFAAKLGIGQDQAAGALSDVIPQIVDKASSGGSLLEQAGGVGGLMGMAKGLFGK